MPILHWSPPQTTTVKSLSHATKLQENQNIRSPPYIDLGNGDSEFTSIATSRNEGIPESRETERARKKEIVNQEFANKWCNLAQTCIHEVAVPNGYVFNKDESVHRTPQIQFIVEDGKAYPFNLDVCQEVLVAHLELNESVFVSIHTSAGKTAITKYAIAMAFRDKQRVRYTTPLKALSN